MDGLREEIADKIETAMYAHGRFDPDMRGVMYIAEKAERSIRRKRRERAKSRDSPRGYQNKDGGNRPYRPYS